MFHAFRCVFEYWKLCVGRFGLGWTHDAIIFSTSHVHAYFMRMYLFFSLFVLSCDCVFCLLPLSFSNRLHMAPKHKSTPTRNPFHSWSSSFSDPLIPSLHVKFRDEKAHQDFFENFSKRGIHLERHVILSDFSNTPLPDGIHTWGWESLWEIPLRCPTMLIQEFYTNIHGIDTSVPQFVMTFKGTHIVVTLDFIFEIRHVPRVSHIDYPGYQCLRIVSKDEFLSHFYETPSIWGEHHNTPCSGFAKGLRFLNMVMTFVLRWSFYWLPHLFHYLYHRCL